jgi:hypothetical protein
VSKLKRNLKIIWDDTTRGAPWEDSSAATRRFIAKSLDGGTGWGIWDKSANRFLKDREVAALTPDQCRSSFAH